MKTRIAFVVFTFLIVLMGRAQRKPERPGITGLAFVRIGVGDMQAATLFYNGALKLPVLTSSCFSPDSKCFFVNPSQQLDLTTADVLTTKNLIEAVGISTTDASGLRNYLLARGQKPEEIITDTQGRTTFQMKDPEQHTIAFVQLSKGLAGSVGGPTALSSRAIHVGFIVKDRAAMDKFYKDILGFHLYWAGGMKDGETSWISMQVPDGTDWIEYMVNIGPDADQHLRGVMNHIALGVPSVKEAAIQLEKGGVKLTEQPKMGRDGKWQLNLYDPDWTRVELMEFTPVEKPCCSEYTGTHPQP